MNIMLFYNVSVNMKIEEFNYHLPKSLIAQYPSPERGASRMMVVHRKNGEVEHRSFQEIIHYFNPGDLLVVNNTRVLPARLIGRKETGGRCEVLLIPRWNGAVNGEWKALIKGVKKQKEGLRIHFEEGVDAEVTEIRDGKATIRFLDQDNMADILQSTGHIPLPPYIKRGDEPLDRTRYQTVFAERDGSIAAPTAGLHFTEKMLQSVREKGASIVSVTLHIGPGTFSPVKTEDVEDHFMETEWTEISPETTQEIERTKQRGGRVIAVGTTTTRALESFSNPEGQVIPGENFSSLFIHPPFRFRVIDGLVTNFHLPQSTLIMLVAAFAGKKLLMKAYQEAVEKKYRFYSYGDAMLIL
ncbi:MAG TPA: tRNA preQ1(34) S-adenosylmethionine ribosyltransferase-isomerase QueA [Thermodesulfobacteriota bacterium]|nr:tRNA preQ1(34) S-adenosylmethionine ribosyltransferase-isomerase QueA [Thermodesulfobacteriota bacterium]